MRRTDLWTLLAAGALIALLYAPGLPARPVYDDATGVLRNPRAVDLARVPGAFLHPFDQPDGLPLPSYGWRPMTEASFALNRLATGNALWGFRLANQLLHFLSALLVFRLARRLSGALGQPPAFARWAALLFAVHPLAVHAVTYIYQRSVALDTLFSLACLNAYLDARERNRGILSLPYALAWLSALLAVASKEPAVTLPLSLAALEWILPGPHGRLRRLAPFLLPPAVGLVQAIRAPLGTAALHSPLQYLLAELPILVRYASLSVLPFPMRFYWDRLDPVPGLPWSPGWAALPCGLLLLAAGAWILLGPGRHRLPRLALALFLAPLALESSVFPILDLAWNYRCVPGLPGTALLLAAAACALPRALPGTALLLLAWMTQAETARWSDREALLRRDVRHAFHVTTVWARYASWMRETGRPAAARALYARACLSPWFDIRAWDGYLRACLDAGHREEAVRLLKGCLARSPKDLQLLKLATEVSEAEGDEEALRRLDDRISALEALHPPLLRWMVRRRIGQSRTGEAEALLERHRVFYEGDPGFWMELARLRIVQARAAEAEAALRRTLSLSPNRLDALDLLGLVQGSQGDWTGAARSFARLLELDPGFPGARERLEDARRRARP